MRELDLNEQFVIFSICGDIERHERLKKNFLRFLLMP